MSLRKGDGQDLAICRLRRPALDLQAHDELFSGLGLRGQGLGYGVEGLGFRGRGLSNFQVPINSVPIPCKIGSLG